MSRLLSVIFLFSFLPLAGMATAHAQISADHWLGGAIRVGPSTTPCEPGSKGAIRYDDDQSVIKFCDGTSWRTVGSTVLGGDNTPDPFSFTDLTGQPLGALVYSNIITITGIDPDVVVHATGAGSPEISINSGPWGTAGFVSAGDTLQIRQITAPTITTTRIAAITIGTLSTNWSATTRDGAMLIFVTTVKYSGAFGGLSAADTICQNQAATHSLPGVFKAFLADNTNAITDRLTFEYPIVTTNGDIVFSTNPLHQGLENRIRAADNSAPNGYDGNSWSGVILGGTTSANLCSDWNSSAGNGTDTSVQGGYSGWLPAATTLCSNTRRLICLQQ